MVRGLGVFREWFSPFVDQYVLIGGTAASLAFEEAAQEFRATKDLDVVLHVEALTADFGRTFWAFIDAGGYEIREVGDTGRPAFYRFKKPQNEQFPFMLELFARAPEALQPMAGSHLTPIPFDEAVSSLSAILLDHDYYAFIMAGRRDADGLSWVGEDRLIPLKALAWLELLGRKQQGDQIDSKNIRKHLNDVLRLSSLLAPGAMIPLPGRLQDDLRRFIQIAQKEGHIDPKALGLGQATLPEVLNRLTVAYGL